MWIRLLAAALVGYLLGSIPFALVIGKLFYKTDIRTAGSKNLGGGNAGRVLGAKAGVAVMTLDILKVAFAIFITSGIQYRESAMITAGLAAAIGHCYPVFAGFKGTWHFHPAADRTAHRHAVDRMAAPQTVGPGPNVLGGSRTGRGVPHRGRSGSAGL